MSSHVTHMQLNECGNPPTFATVILTTAVWPLKWGNLYDLICYQLKLTSISESTVHAPSNPIYNSKTITVNERRTESNPRTGTVAEAG